MSRVTQSESPRISSENTIWPVRLRHVNQNPVKIETGYLCIPSSCPNQQQTHPFTLPLPNELKNSADSNLLKFTFEMRMTVISFHCSVWDHSFIRMLALRAQQGACYNQMSITIETLLMEFQKHSKKKQTYKSVSIRLYVSKENLSQETTNQQELVN